MTTTLYARRIDWDKFIRTPGGNNRGVARQRQAEKRAQAEIRNAITPDARRSKKMKGKI